MNVQVLSCIPRCTRVYVEPMKACDWELLETYADALESGLLLQQVSVVYKKQRLTLSLNRDKIEVLIQSISTSKEGEGSDNCEDSVYGLLLQDTEVIISPKLRTSSAVVDWTPPQRLIPCQNDWNDTMIDLQALSKVPLSVTVPPVCVIVNEAIWVTGFEWAILESSNNDCQETKRRLVRVLTNSKVPKGEAGRRQYFFLCNFSV